MTTFRPIPKPNGKSLISASLIGSWESAPKSVERCHQLLVFGLLLLMSCFFPVAHAAAPAPDGTLWVVEYFHRDLRYYFRTSDLVEINLLDSGVGGTAWSRTGDDFLAYPANDFPLTAAPVCRFYGSADPGPNGHFFTANINEVRALQRAELETQVTTKRWNYEGMAFAIKAPASNGSCPADSPLKVYRAYNIGFARHVDSNHRLVSDPALYAQMIAAGWIGEGVVMCGPV